MPPCIVRLALVLTFSGLAWSQLPAQEDSGWRISPEKINVGAGEDRRLQLLNDSAQEIRGAEWSVDHPELADLTEENGRETIRTKAAGLVTVTATVNFEKRSREIKIWPADQPMPVGISHWGSHSLGRDLGDIAAVPTADGVNLFSLEETPGGNTYLRGYAEDGIQEWAWLLPEKNQQVELVCGDWLGGALISSNDAGSFTLYTVGKDGKLRWQHTVSGARKSHAYSLDHHVYILSQSADKTVAKITGFDDMTGSQKFELTVPVSHEKRVNVRKTGTKLVCASQPALSAVPGGVSSLFVNTDGFAYFAFTQQEWELKTSQCKPGAEIQLANINQVRVQHLELWQIHPDGSVRSTTLEESSSSRSFSEPVNVVAPTGAIIPDGLDGILLAVGSLRTGASALNVPPDELIYRVDEDGKLLYKLLLPSSEGQGHNDMVLGQDGLGFTTRGGILIAFSVPDGKELWRWDSQTPNIQVFAALANGGCMVQTPTALVEVDNSTDAKEIFKGKAAVDWQGNLYRKELSAAAP
jgi:outer membrane protein assembly factor BamB